MRSDTKFEKEKEYRKHGIIRKTGKKLYRKHELEKRKINRKNIFKKYYRNIYVLNQMCIKGI